MKTELKIKTVSEQSLFTRDGMEYYLVKFEAEPGVRSSTHRDAKNALDEAGHVPAVIRGTEILKDLYDGYSDGGWITLFDCREDMKEKVGFFVGRSAGDAIHYGLASKFDGLMFYHLDHGGAPGEHPALCWREAR